MDVPGMSLFQGAESLQINNSEQQRIEEEDAIEDRLRRNEEVCYKILKKKKSQYNFNNKKKLNFDQIFS